ncbi:peptidase [Martelella alba]|uniref:Acyl-CoA:diacylglycerol acyltransferase n=1 Tax=Martelella alba TaxID=2590451 RepID=A0A506U186_9HYPH|nr:prolyl oligopeptidase family serine peptidase [Martelella alba]TPW26744.1 peptidase [Martelella alba]
MSYLSRRNFMLAGAAVASLGLCLRTAAAQSAANGFNIASSAMPGADDGPKTPGIQGITAICEVTGGGEKVYGIAVEYDTAIDPESLSLDSFATGVVPAAEGYFPGMPTGPDKDATTAPAAPRAVAAIYTNAAAALRPDQKSVAGRYVIAEFAHAEDLSLPTTDSDMVSLTQLRDVKTSDGVVYAAVAKQWSNVGARGNSVVIRGVDAWEQNHWWWDDSRSAWLEYSIYLPKSFLEPGGEEKSYPLLLAITHSGTSYDGTCAQTLTETCIASIWGMPEEQARHECVVITPRYERTTMNDYWEHTPDVENTYRLVQSLMRNTWNFGNPNLADRRDKVLKIDPSRVYCTGWSMGAMTTLWLMAKHPETFAAGLVIAGQQRPQDVETLATQNLLIITGSEDQKATPWEEECVPVWREAGGTVTRPDALLDPALIFPVDDQHALTAQVDDYLGEGGNITFLTFDGVDHMGSARRFFYIKAARDWLFSQTKKA